MRRALTSGADDRSYTVNQFADRKYGCEFLHGASCRGLVKWSSFRSVTALASRTAYAVLLGPPTGQRTGRWGHFQAMQYRHEKDVTERDGREMDNLVSALLRPHVRAHAATDVIRGGESGSFVYSAGRPHE